MTIREMEHAMGISKANIRFYEKEGLLSPKRASNNYREYTDEDRVVLEKIKYLRMMGISVAQIRLFMEGRRDLDTLMEERIAQIEEETAQLNRWKSLCGEMKKQDWDFDSLDTGLLSIQMDLQDRKGREIMKEDRGSILIQVRKWLFLICLTCILSMVFFPINTFLKIPVSESVMNIWIAVILFSPFPYWILYAITGGEGSGKEDGNWWGEREIRHSENKRNHYRGQIEIFNQLCIVSTLIIPINRIFHIQMPLWLIVVWLVIVFGSMIALAVVKNMDQ